MAAYTAGDQAAFRELFARFTPALLGLFRRQGGNAHDAQDLLQQTFLHLHRARLDFRPGNLVRPWLFTIALNCRRELGRKRGRRRETVLDSEPAERDAAPASGALEAGEDRALVRRGLAELPDAQREVIELHWFQGVAFSEIATIVGASVSAVKVRAHRGYERLRELLARRGAGDPRREEVPRGLS